MMLLEQTLLPHQVLELLPRLPLLTLLEMGMLSPRLLLKIKPLPLPLQQHKQYL